MATINSTTFDTTSTATIATASEGVSHKIVALSIHNNETEFSHSDYIRIISGATPMYGSAAAAARMAGRGDVWFLPFIIGNDGEPEVYFDAGVNKTISILVGTGATGYRFSGIVWYITE